MRRVKSFPKLFVVFCLCVITLFSCNKEEDNEPTILTASGTVATTMEQFRNLLGPNNGGTAGSKPGGRREINWDGVPDDMASPNGYVGNFFNQNKGEQARGIEFTTPGTGLKVGADKNNPTNTPTSFGEINASYSRIFPPFSGERIFSPVGSNIAEATFYVPGSSTKAVVQGFGAIYIDVDTKENQAFEFFDINGKLIGKYGTPVQNEGHVFLGIYFDKPIIHRVRITYGNAALGPDDGGSIDVSVMDDFIFGEPQPVK